jgi:hypothetical protein
MTMSDTPARIRRRISHERPVEEQSSRRAAWWAGAALGIVAGTIIAFFVVPPLMNRYFGTADLGLGSTHRADGGAYTMTEFSEEPGADGTRILVATFRATSREGAKFGIGGARLHLEGGAILAPAPGIDGAAPPGALTLEPGADLTLTLRFVVPAGLGTKPEYVEFTTPRARFHVEPGEPE